MARRTSRYQINRLFVRIGKLEADAIKLAPGMVGSEQTAMLEVAVRLQEAWKILSDRGIVS